MMARKKGKKRMSGKLEKECESLREGEAIKLARRGCTVKLHHFVSHVTPLRAERRKGDS
jgi:hypothetical protein